MGALAWELGVLHAALKGPAETKPDPSSRQARTLGVGTTRQRWAHQSSLPRWPDRRPAHPRGPTFSLSTASSAACSCRPRSSSWSLRLRHSSLAVWRRERACGSGVLARTPPQLHSPRWVKTSSLCFPPNSIRSGLDRGQHPFRFLKRLNLVLTLRIQFPPRKRGPYRPHRAARDGGHSTGGPSVEMPWLCGSERRLQC